jgi:chemotaxis protein CheX
MNVAYINPLLESTIDVLSTMAFMQAKPNKPQLKKDKRANGDITGFIHLNGNNAAGWMALSFDLSTILSVVKNMVGDQLTQIDESVMDCVGEITNMITGGAKRRYQSLGLDIDLARPGVFIGRETEMDFSQPGASIVLPFVTKDGNLAIEFFFK